MKSLIMYDEFGKGMGLPSMRNSFCKEPYKGMDKIIEYLKNGSITYVTATKNVDIFTNEVLPGFRSGMTDGKYTWNSVLPYYVQKYNLKLNDDFIQHVLSQ